MGTKFLAEQKYVTAIDLFDHAISLNPKYADAYCARGYAYECNNNYKKAKWDYNKALEIEPEHAEAHKYKAKLQKKLEPTSPFYGH